jgi:hypothetical protein
MHFKNAAAACALIPILAACATMPTPAIAPLAIGDGQGSEHGNYPTVPTGETHQATDGSLCPVFEWDRPLSATTAIRYRSTTCPLPGQPGRFYSFNLDRTVIPLAESRIPAYLAETARERAAQPPTDGRAPPPAAVTATPLAPPPRR